MNRRGFLTEFLKGIGVVTVTPSIVTHGLHLARKELCISRWLPNDVPIGGVPINPPGWTAKDFDLYHELPFYMAKIEVNRVNANHSEAWKNFTKNRSKFKKDSLPTLCYSLT